MTRVSVVIPTVGRDSLNAAIASALAQTHPVTEVLVMVDVTEPISMNVDDPRVRVLVVGERTGPASARQRGVEAAIGEVIALLDDDDLWRPNKIERQLREVGAQASEHMWIASCRHAVRWEGRPDKIFPRRLIKPREPVWEYLFSMPTPRFGGATMQASTLCFPRDVALKVPLDSDPDAVHDEPTWLHRVQQTIPDVTFHQLADCLTVYTVTEGSVSNTGHDDSTRYIDWGRAYLADASPRARGDYFLSSPVSAAASAHSPRSIVKSMRVGFTLGRPGPSAMIYAIAKLALALRPGSRRATHHDGG